MPKVAIIGAGNVGGFSSLRICQEKLAEVVLIDIAPGLACGKGLDIEDAGWLLDYQPAIKGSDDFSLLKDSEVIVITAGFARKPGESRQDLLNKNSLLIKDISSKIKQFSPQSIIIVVTNPVDIMTYLVHKSIPVDRKRIIGLGISLDASRFANQIVKELGCQLSEVEPMLISSHNERMMPLARFTKVKGRPLSEMLKPEKAAELIQKTKNRGAEIVSHLGSGSAYVAPSAAVLRMVKAVLSNKPENTLGSAVLQGEYGLKDVCIGVPIIVGKSGVEKIIELDLNPAEKAEFLQSAEELKKSV
jgi:malate dehydrogenase